MTNIEDIEVALLAERYMMTNSHLQVWLCKNVWGWYITTNPKKLEGSFARGTIGKGDSNGAIRNLAEDLLTKVKNHEATIR